MFEWSKIPSSHCASCTYKGLMLRTVHFITHANLQVKYRDRDESYSNCALYFLKVVLISAFEEAFKIW